MDLSRYTELFLAETREHLATVNRLLLSLESRPGDRAAVDEVFRAVHTIKGMAATMGFATTADLAHALEHLLDKLRAGALQVDGKVVDLLLQAADAVEGAAEREAAAPARPSHRREGGPAEAPRRTVPAVPRRVAVSISRTSPAPAARALLVLRRARALGTVDEVAPDEAQLGTGQFDGTLSFLLTCDEAGEVIRSALTAAGDVELVAVEQTQAPEGAGGRQSGGAESGFVRIRQERLDTLLNQLGELVIARDRLANTAASVAREDVGEAVADVSRLVTDLQGEIMQLRMVPVGEVFDRFPRLVRDAARSLAKQVELEVRGRDQELDRSLLNELGDSLVHLLRNAIDHGIEAPAERMARGKRETGLIRLTAERDRSRLTVRVQDDGRGIQRMRVLRTAIERGLVDPGRQADLSDAEIFDLLTRPGFSTAERVTDVSGRGVGLDTVQASLHRLGGSLEVESTEGVGTVCIVRIPLTLAIIRVLLVEARGVSYALPVGSVVEVTEVGRRDARDLSGEWVDRRGDALPVLDLGELLHADRPDRGVDPAPAVVAEVGGTRFLLFIDTIRGQQEAVLKRFDGVVQMVDVFSGATLLSDGRPALVLDAAKLATHLRGALAADAA